MTQPRWLALAWGDLGVAETPGADHTRRVVRYYADVGHAQITNDETAWCAAFLGSCLERAGIASTRSLMARSYLAWGEPLAEFRTGAVAVLSRTADPALGHAGFLIGETADSVILLGGNQGDAVTVEAFPRSRLLGPALAPSTCHPGRRVSACPGPRAASDALFNRALAHVLEMEGGWTDDPYDPGGPTNFGITLATYARDQGIELTAANVAAITSELKSIPAATVRRIYRERYWLLASLPATVRAARLLPLRRRRQPGRHRRRAPAAGGGRRRDRRRDRPRDARPGRRTPDRRNARPLRRRAPPALPLSLHLLALRQGWLARVDRTLAAARAIARALPPRSPAQQQEQTSMTDTTQPASPVAAPDTKWWGQSMTIWGVIITTLSTVLPAFGPLLGLDITAELIRQLGDQIVVVVQAVGGLIGTILAIWGRARATASLERKQLTMNL